MPNAGELSLHGSQRVLWRAYGNLGLGDFKAESVDYSATDCVYELNGRYETGEIVHFLKNTSG